MNRSGTWLRIASALGLLTILSLFSMQAEAAVPIPPERKIEAVLLFHIAQLSEWPGSAFPDETAPFVFAVLGTDPFGEVLEATVKGEKIRGRSIVIKRFAEANEVEKSHLIFVSRTSRNDVSKILPRLAAEHTMVVTDLPYPDSKGCMVRFRIENGKVRMRINLQAVQSAGLVLSPRLLSVAETES